jgi:hypothetical protein
MGTKLPLARVEDRAGVKSSGNDPHPSSLPETVSGFTRREGQLRFGRRVIAASPPSREQRRLKLDGVGNISCGSGASPS